MKIDNDHLTPSDSMIKEHSGGITRENFLSMGEEIVTHSFIGFGQLQPHHRVLDVGCGCGKISRSLVKFLNQAGRYDGIDITHEVIDWCQDAYRDYPNFQFHHADLYSERYNPNGTHRTAEYSFPFTNDQFDLIFLGSVFTHLLPLDTDHYLSEIARVMKPGARCLATFFVLDDESRSNVKAGVTTPKFEHEYEVDGCRVECAALPEAAIAYDQDFLRKIYAKHALDITVLSFGEWGRKRLVPHWQDEIWSHKPITHD